MKSFKNYLESGGYAIVSCKDRSNKNFQIWGALSDLNCDRKKTKKFKEWLKNKINEDITDGQNQAIKQLYIVIRNILFDFRQQIFEKGYTKFDDTKDFINFYSNLKKIYKPSNNVKGFKPSGSGLWVDIPKGTLEVLPKLAEPFYLSFPMEENEIGGLVIHGWGELKDRSDEMRINLHHLINDFDGYKIVLQHELQHLIDTGTDVDQSIDNILLRTIKYQCHIGEISAFAKQYAYIYYKHYPNDNVLDFVKFKSTFYKSDKIPKTHQITLNNYINFGEDIERLVQKYGLDNQQKENMLNCYNSFIENLKRSFLYYKKTPGL